MVRTALLALVMLLVAGCAAPAPPSRQPAAEAPSAGPRPGLFTVDEAGLHETEDLTGLTVRQEGVTTTYTLDVTAILEANTLSMLLVEALANLTAKVSYDADVAYDPMLQPSGDVKPSDAICIGTSLLANPRDHGFYLDRALGRPGTPPEVREDHSMGNHTGHGVGGPKGEVIALYGERFQHSGRATLSLRVGQAIRVSDHVSQITPQEVRQPGNHWTQTWTVDGPVRILRIPSAPVYCASGFGEFDGAQQVGVTTVGGELHLKTRYGTSVNINAYGAGDDTNPANSATVRFGDRVCRAAEGKGVSLNTFEAGEVAVTVDRWVGSTWVFLVGLGPWQDVVLRDAGEQCPA
ncbi:MAG TPA: hypothetical protein VM286_08465 [Candidatus Thermoplasmatota archaeon]|nr:hypothetical protein [Candidatus Thermoplasmatota archaeon]